MKEPALTIRVLAAPSVLVLAGAFGVVGLTPPPLSAQSSGPDSATVRTAARSAQARFERTRRRELPATAWSSSGPCDEQLGRMCFRHDGDEREPVPEGHGIAQARAHLLEDLDSLVSRIPGDGWVVGQLVWYRIEAGDTAGAVAAAGRCRSAETWRCHALEGLALHVQGRWTDAERAFDRALGSMPEGTRREWTDLDVLLDSSARGWLGDALDREAAGPDVPVDAPEQPLRANPAVDRIWTLSDPFLLEPGNERRSAHFARWTLAGIRDGAGNPYGLSWGGDLSELLIRYGWEEWWERTRPSPGLTETAVIGHHDHRGRQFMPPGDLLRDPERFRPDGPSVWEPEAERPRSSYTAPRAPDLRPPGPHQVVRFRRGGRLVVVVAADTTRWTGFARPDLAAGPTDPERGQVSRARSGIFLVDEAGGVTASTGPRRLLGGAPPPTPAQDGADRAPLLHAAAAGPGEYVLSFEAIDRSAGVGWRARSTLELELPPEDVPSISDLLLTRPDRAPATLIAALEGARGSTVATSEERIGLAWEIYGFAARGQPVEYTVSVRPASHGFFERAGRWLGLAGDDVPLLLAWSEALPGDGDRFFRSVDVDLPDLDDRPYRLRLEARVPGREPMVAEVVLTPPQS